MSLSTTEFRQACGLFATGVAVLTAFPSAGEPLGITINSFVSLSLEPALVMAAIAHSSGHLSAFDASEYFAVNVLAEDQKDISARFAKTGNQGFEGIAWEPGITGAPVLAGTIAVLECRVTQRLDTGDHRVLIGETLSALAKTGKPLLYFRSGYRSLVP